MAYETVEQVFEQGMPTRFNANEARGETASYLFRVRDGSDVSEWTVAIVNGQLSVVRGNPGMPHCVLTITKEDFLDMANGKESIQMLYMVGKLVVEGDLPYAVKMARYFPAEKK